MAIYVYAYNVCVIHINDQCMGSSYWTCIYVHNLKNLYFSAGEMVDSGHICSLPPKTGPCRAQIPRYYHNIETGECETFIYGGCQGNANNFRTKEECEEKCGELIMNQ